MQAQAAVETELYNRTRRDRGNQRKNSMQAQAAVETVRPSMDGKFRPSSKNSMQAQAAVETEPPAPLP